MPNSSPKRSSSQTPSSSRSGFGPRRLAEVATRRPGRMLAGWGVIVLVSLALIGTLLGSALTSDSSLTNHPESVAAQELIDARLPNQEAVDEFIVVRSEDLEVSDAAFEARVSALAADIRRTGGAQRISSYLDPAARRSCPPIATPPCCRSSSPSRRTSGSPISSRPWSAPTAARDSPRTSRAATRSTATSRSSPRAT